MYSLVQGMFNQNRLRDIIRNFIYIPDSSKKNEKIVCRYPQYYAAKRLYENIKLAQRPEGDGKGALLQPEHALDYLPYHLKRKKKRRKRNNMKNNQQYR